MSVPSSELGRGTNHTSKILSLQSKEVPTDMYWVKVKVLATLTLMCDHSPQHTNSNRRNVVYVCCSVLTILDVLNYVTQFCVVMDTIHVITVVIVAVVPSLCFRYVGRV